MEARSTTYVIVVRHPDYENDYTVVGPGPVETIDIDLGRADLDNEDERLEWLLSHKAAAEAIRAAGDHEAAQAYLDIVLAVLNPDDQEEPPAPEHDSMPAITRHVERLIDKHEQRHHRPKS